MQYEQKHTNMTEIPPYKSPFLAEPPENWLCSNDLAFAIFDKHPVSRGHTLITTKRIALHWFEATNLERLAMMYLIDEVKYLLDVDVLDSIPDGYNIGFNDGAAAGQTILHFHIHVIPRYLGDMDDPRGGVRHCIPAKGNYLNKETTTQL